MPPTERPRRHLRHLLAVAALLVVAGGTLAACGGGGSSATSSSTTTTVPAGTLPPAAASTAAIKHAYSVLFDLADPAVAPKVAVVYGGSALQSTFETALKSSLAKLAGGAKVHSVAVLSGSACSAELLPSPCAKVVYDILSPSGKVLIGGASGFAVYSGGSWYVAKATICTLLGLEDSNQTPKGC